ncbi:hypothetical protein SAY87_004710 [Trapa incisa]|uniref:Uncharacterized protein n=1 Tax=Trapa incisa TaxID=236973 RepID=A0AAN7JQB3_9MYRT|nr:hypothetical protein SAY87_004710 [Trapa incisa]
MGSRFIHLKPIHLSLHELPRRSSRSRCPPQLHRLRGAAAYDLKIPGSVIQRNSQCLQRTLAFDYGSFDIPSLDGWGDNESTSSYMISSSDGEDSDGEIIVNPPAEADLPRVKVSANDALTLSTHRFAMIGRRHKRHRIKYGAFINIGLISFLTIFLLLVDCCAWRIVRLPLEPFYLTRPFFMSAVIASFVGYIFVPLFYSLHMYQIIRKEGPYRHSIKKKTTPTMGGLLFVPIGVAVAQYIVGLSCIEVAGAAAVTLAYAVIGLLDDTFSLSKNQNYGLSSWSRIFLEVAVGIIFSLWLDSAGISSPYGMYIFLQLL